jgi:hypothetical protein
METMNFFKKLAGKGAKSSDCCGVEIKEVETPQEESCCSTADEQQSSCC